MNKLSKTKSLSEEGPTLKKLVISAQEKEMENNASYGCTVSGCTCLQYLPPSTASEVCARCWHPRFVHK